MSWGYLSYCFKFFFFWISTAPNQKAYFVTSSVVTSPKRNLGIQIGPDLQFCMHCISAKYHSFRLHTFEGETFGRFDFLHDHQTGNHRNAQPKIFLETCIVAFRNMSLKETKLLAQEFQKLLCLSCPHRICEPLSLKKSPACEFPA